MAWSKSAADGSSPLTRGKLLHGALDVQRARLIPAHAGKTLGEVLERYVAGAHPRSRGENGEKWDTSTPNVGSSPLTRGKPGNRQDQSEVTRLIPAHAGKTHPHGYRRAPTPAHPRSRGENLVAIRAEAEYGGSSPAHAGKTSCSRCVILAGRAHPRSRGENRAGGRNPVVETGSSPLTRGKPAPVVETEGLARLIPAHAGKTMETAASARFRRAHPRSRGENFNQSFRFSAGAGSSPLTRGKQSVLPACRVP